MPDTLLIQGHTALLVALALGHAAVLTAAIALLGAALLVGGRCFVAAIAGAACRLSARTPRTLAVLVPARGDPARVAATVTELRRQVRLDDRLLAVDVGQPDALVAARAAGAEVVERGGHGRVAARGDELAAAVRDLAGGPPDAIVLIEPGVRPSVGAVVTLAAHALATDRPVRPERQPDAAADAARPGLLATLERLEQRVRPRAHAALGLPVSLDGGLLALPWSLAHTAAQLGDLGLGRGAGVELALRGTAPLACVRAVVSGVPAAAAAEAVHRTPRAVARLAQEALRAGRPDLLVHAIDLALPGLRRLLALHVTALAVGAATFALGGSNLLLVLATAGLVVLAAGLGAAALRLGVRAPAAAVRPRARQAEGRAFTRQADAHVDLGSGSGARAA